MKYSLYIYLDYRQYLRDYYRRRKSAQPGFSYRVFSRGAGVKAPNFLQWLIEGKRNLAKETIASVVKALGLSGNDAEYFTGLVLFNQAKTIAEKTRCFLNLAKLRKPGGAARIEEDKFEHYRSWYNEAIRELLRYYRFNPSEKYAYRKLARMLCPEINESMARKAIRQLLKLGFVSRASDSTLRQTDRFITTGDEVDSFLVQVFHQAMIYLAGESLDRIPKERRDISCVSMSISGECFSLIKGEIQVFRKRILDLVKMDRNPRNVYQLNFQFFPLTSEKRPVSDDEGRTRD